MIPRHPEPPRPALGPAGPGRALLAAAAHLALWSGLYVAAAVFAFADLAGLWAAIPARQRLQLIAFALCTAAATYLLDRVKLRDRWLDPADESAHPARFRFLARRSRTVRLFILALLATAGLLGAAMSPFAPLLVLASAIGVTAYAGRPRRARPRIKDVLLVKNLFVAAGITGFAALITFLARDAGRPGELRAAAPAIVASAVHLLIRIWADAALCDLDDEAADRAHGTSTLATELGRARAWNTALTLRLMLSVALLTIMPGPRAACTAWALVTAASSIALRIARPAHLRDWVDARFPAEAVAAWALARLFS